MCWMGGMAAPGAGDNEQFPVLLACLDHPVDLGWRGCGRLLNVDVGIGCRGGHGQFIVITDLARGNDGDVGALCGQHLPVVGIALGGAGAFDRLLAAGFVRVGESNDRRALHTDKRLVDIVAIIAAPGVSDDGYSIGHGSSAGVASYIPAPKSRNQAAGKGGAASTAFCWFEHFSIGAV